MAQNFNYENPATGVTTFGNLYSVLRDHQDAIRSCFSGTAFPSNPLPGQPCFRTDRNTDYGGALYYYSGDPTIGEVGWIDEAQASLLYNSLETEVHNARGTAASLDARLDVAINEDGTLKSSAPAGSWWMTEADAVTYVSATQFTVNGDKTAIYVSGRAIHLIQTTEAYGYVDTSTYDGVALTTTVTVYSATVDTGLTGVEYGQPVSSDPHAVLVEMLPPGSARKITDSSSNTILQVDESTGYVGIGTTSPGAKLEVNGHTLTLDNSSSTGATLNIIGATAYDNIISIHEGITEVFRIQTDASQNTVSIKEFESDGSIVIGTIGGSLTINSAGNVGIGTTGPEAKLEVNGGVRLNTADARPVASATYRGMLWVTQGATGEIDTIDICLKSSLDTYSWVNIFSYANDETDAQRFTNLIKNGLFYSWSAGTSAVPDGWSIYSGGSVAKGTDNNPWAASTAYVVDDICVSTTFNGYAYKCTTAGTSDTAEPTWPTTTGATVTDGTVVWTCIETIGSDYATITSDGLGTTAAGLYQAPGNNPIISTWFDICKALKLTVTSRVKVRTTSTAVVLDTNSAHVSAAGTGSWETLTATYTFDGTETGFGVDVRINVADNLSVQTFDVAEFSLTIGPHALPYQENPLDRALQAVHYQDTTPTNYEYRGLRVEAGRVSFATDGVNVDFDKTITFQKAFKKYLGTICTINDHTIGNSYLWHALGVSGTSSSVLIRASYDGAAPATGYNAYIGWIALGVD